MANWGRPDFTDVVTDEEKKSLALRCIQEGYLFEWPHNDQVERGYPPQDVQQFCVRHSSWQQLRLAMKGQDTGQKLNMLKAWWDKHIDVRTYATKVQVGNYLGALRRGGQLDDNNHIRRWR